jgi:uncharacterized SAM-binding protein YcdF (DUF218 family)
MIEIIKYFILPSNLIILFFILGCIFFVGIRKKRIAIYFYISAVVFYIIFGCGTISYWLLGNLEYQYPALNSLDDSDRIDTIVVLSGYAEADYKIPISSSVNSSSAYRIIEAIRIFRNYPKAKIIISGSGDIPNIIKQLAVSIGLNPNNIGVENQSTSTYESALNLQKELTERKIVLVTSAGHMPRAMAVFKKFGMNPTPAPTDYMSKKNYLAISYLPSPLHLMYSDLAVYEYLGLLWYRLSNRL